jgi:hypothetical protein
MSLAATGLQMFGQYVSSRGVAAGDQYRAEELQRAAVWRPESDASQRGAISSFKTDGRSIHRR